MLSLEVTLYSPVSLSDIKLSFYSNLIKSLLTSVNVTGGG